MKNVKNICKTLINRKHTSRNNIERFEMKLKNIITSQL